MLQKGGCSAHTLNMLVKQSHEGTTYKRAAYSAMRVLQLDRQVGIAQTPKHATAAADSAAREGGLTWDAANFRMTSCLLPTGSGTILRSGPMLEKGLLSGFALHIHTCKSNAKMPFPNGRKKYNSIGFRNSEK